jgi:hypothetical protein
MYTVAVKKCNILLQERNVVAIRAGMFAAFYRKRSDLV